MIPKECKCLAEVDFPIVKVSARSAHEKSIRHGHPSTLYLLVGAGAVGGVPPAYGDPALLITDDCMRP